jgi:hypothetical protein
MDMGKWSPPCILYSTLQRPNMASPLHRTPYLLAQPTSRAQFPLASHLHHVDAPVGEVLGQVGVLDHVVLVPRVPAGITHRDRVYL